MLTSNNDINNSNSNHCSSTTVNNNDDSNKSIGQHPRPQQPLLVGAAVRAGTSARPALQGQAQGQHLGRRNSYILSNFSFYILVNCIHLYI